ncbi:MAG: HD domain-containing protein [Thermoleophilaceae bacterium]|nr:HD domain-containing protein [Thermoleophilaceae bacterium]
MSVPARLQSAIGATPALAQLMPVLVGYPQPHWLVGGVVRDLWLGREITDVDIAVAADAKPLAKHIHAELGGDIFSLSDRFGTWRVQPAGTSYHVDISVLRGETIGQDLAQRDFSVGAMALAVEPELATNARLEDPFGGLSDLENNCLRVLGPAAYEDDALRPLRAARLATQLNFVLDDETVALTKRFAGGVATVAAERVFGELCALLTSDDPVAGVTLLIELGLADAVLPELTALDGVTQSVYHHKDVLGHTLEVLQHTVWLETNLAEVFGAEADAIASQLDQPLADDLTRGQALRFAALLHDIAKPQTRTVHENGRIGFPAHDREGVRMVHAICKRLHTSEKFSRYIEALTLNHLHLGYLVDSKLDRHAIYRYLSTCQPVEVEVGVLSVADRMATNGRKAEAAIPAHLAVAHQINQEALAWRAARDDEPLIRGGELAAALGIEPGPQLGELLGRIDEARFVGQLTTAQSAIDFARTQVGAAEHQNSLGLDARKD